VAFQECPPVCGFTITCQQREIGTVLATQPGIASSQFVGLVPPASPCLTELRGLLLTSCMDFLILNMRR
jgi:hypothetical protein